MVSFSTSNFAWDNSYCSHVLSFLKKKHNLKWLEKDILMQCIVHYKHDRFITLLNSVFETETCFYINLLSQHYFLRKGRVPYPNREYMSQGLSNRNTGKWMSILYQRSQRIHSNLDLYKTYYFWFHSLSYSCPHKVDYLLVCKHIPNTITGKKYELVVRCQVLYNDVWASCRTMEKTEHNEQSELF